MYYFFSNHLVSTIKNTCFKKQLENHYTAQKPIPGWKMNVSYTHIGFLRWLQGHNLRQEHYSTPASQPQNDVRKSNSSQQGCKIGGAKTQLQKDFFGRNPIPPAVCPILFLELSLQGELHRLIPG